MLPPGFGRPTLSPLSPDNTNSKNLLGGAEEEVNEVAESSEDEEQNLDAATPEQTPEESEQTREPSPAPQLPPREKTDWKALLEPLLHKLLLRVKKALRKIQQLHCPVCLRYEVQESNLEDICEHLKAAHNNHLLRGLGEDTQNKLFAEVRSIYMEDVSNEEADEYVDGNASRKVLHKFCVEPLDKTYSCDLCNVNELSVKEMVQHLRGAHGFRMYPCLECGQQFKTYGYFISHLVSTGKESIYGCRLCGIVGMVSLYMLQSHLRTHSLCDICHTCFESQTALRKHMFNHQQDSPYACTVCQVSYKNYESLEMHLLWKHGTESKPCPTCQEKTWLCTYHFCPGAPASLAEVVDNPCVCTVCRLEFSKASMLKVHTRLHTGERPHKCHSCKKSFISKKLLAKHAVMKHSEAAVNQAAVAQAAANEIKSALEKSGLKPRKVQQELLKLIGQQNAAKRSAASSRRVSTEDSPDTPDKAKADLTNGGSTETPPEPIVEKVRFKCSLSSDDDDDEDMPMAPIANVTDMATKLVDEDKGNTSVSVVSTLNRIGSSIFDIEDDEEEKCKPNVAQPDTGSSNDNAHPSQSDAEANDLKNKETVVNKELNEDEAKPDEDKEGTVSKMEQKESPTSSPILGNELKSEPMDVDGLNGPVETIKSAEGEPSSSDVNLLDLLASAATSKQAEIPVVTPEPAIPALLDHDYCKLGDPPPEDPKKLKRLAKKARHHKKHRSKKEPRYVLDLSSSSSSDEDEESKLVNGKPAKSLNSRPGKFGKVLTRLSDSESSCCPTDCSCSSSSSSNSSSSSSGSSSSDSDSDSSSSSSSSDEDVLEEKPPAPAVVQAPEGDEADVDIENNSEPPSSLESSSDSENGVESDADISVHESDLETSDSDSENKKRSRFASPKARSDSQKKRKKKKKKRRALKESSLNFNLDGISFLIRCYFLKCLNYGTNISDFL